MCRWSFFGRKPVTEEFLGKAKRLQLLGMSQKTYKVVFLLLRAMGVNRSQKNGCGIIWVPQPILIPEVKTMKNKKLVLIAIALIACVAVMLGIFIATRPETTAGAKTITVTVVHKDGSEKVFACATDAEYLGQVLVSENIVVGSYGEFGLYFDTADGEKADWNVDNGWWQVFIGEEAAMVGADQIPIANGNTFKLVYTIG